METISPYEKILFQNQNPNMFSLNPNPTDLKGLYSIPACLSCFQADHLFTLLYYFSDGSEATCAFKLVSLLEV